MANYENIKEYAEFSHKVAPIGGPEAYVKKVAELCYKKGAETERGKAPPSQGRQAQGLFCGK